MSTYAALVDVNEELVQNAQELASVWGDIRVDIDNLDGELQDAYAILGSHDYLVIFEAPDRNEALQISVAIERYGLDMETMEVIPVDELGQLVDEI